MKILIVKLGLSETLDPEIGRISSLGDVLRTTPILQPLKNKYPDSKITWVVDDAAYPLVSHNKNIDRVLVWDTFTGFQLMEERFDIVINLEKIPGLCAITNRINAWKKYGFRFDEISGSYNVYEGSEYAFDLCTKHEIKRSNNKYWQEILIEMIGCQWNEQPYNLGYQPKTVEKFDVGFNYKVGSKFPQKAWEENNWKMLQSKLDENSITVSWQEGLSNIYEYIDWINSNRLIVTCDSLGLHIALALGKPIVAMFGPTSSGEVLFYSGCKVIERDRMTDIGVQEVYENVIQLLGNVVG